jgi:hypothetical protein
MRTAPLLALVAGCTLTEDGFADAFADRWCARSKACDEDAYFDRWREGTAECVPSTADDVLVESFGPTERTSCRFEEALAVDCLDRLGRATCEEIGSATWYQECIAAWDCIAIVD